MVVSKRHHQPEKEIQLNELFRVIKPLEVQPRSLYFYNIHLESMDLMEMMPLDVA